MGLTKRCLKKVLGNARLSHDELHTILVETEGTLNARPLTYVGSELEGEILTPVSQKHQFSARLPYSG